MSYFDHYYDQVRYPIAQPNKEGLRRAQLGAIQAVSSQFTLRDEPAIVVMPTGSGKTAVLMLTAYVLRATKALVITPSRLVRYQIAREYETLLTLKRAGVLSLDVPTPRVHEVESTLDSNSAWRELQPYDIVIGTPNSTSPAMEGVAPPPPDLFDLLLVDEAHHSSAKIWNELLDAFPQAKRVLFTATPYRRDRREIKGRLAYAFPVSEAYKDGIFGNIRYVPVAEGKESENDVRIARAAEQVFNDDRAAGFQHLLMVRTDTKTRAKELKKVYEAHTKLKLQQIDSDHSYSHIKRMLEKLRAGELDGVICVDMLGEGFDLSQLKIAAIHAPHKSLAITLQFIGRFARTNGANIGEAKFLAVPSEVEGEVGRLYREDTVWQEMVTNLSEGRIEEEVENREILDTFESPTVTEPETKDVSLYALRPYSHVKIYQVAGDVDVDLELDLPASYEIIFRSDNPQHSTTVFITRVKKKPRWTGLAQFAGADHHLFVVYYDPQTRLLFINSSCRDESLYEDLSSALTLSLPRQLPLNRINKVLLGLENFDFFNIGMRSRMLKNNKESYRIIAGSGAQKAISRSDSRLYNRGHIFGRAQEGSRFITLGYSSSSKVWSNTSTSIPQLITWCRSLAERIQSDKEVTTHSGLDWVPVGETITQIPEGVIAAEWDVDAFNSPSTILLRRQDGSETVCQLLDVELKIDRQNSNTDRIRVCLCNDEFEWFADYTLNATRYFSPVETGDASFTLTVHRGHYHMKMIDYLNTRPLNFFFTDFSRLHGSEHFKSGSEEMEPFDAPTQIAAIDWDGSNVDIQIEFGACADGKCSVHDFLKKHLADPDTQIVFYDHGPGEIADFVTFAETEEEIFIRLYHCKGVGGPAPGKRFDDLSEVCAQVVKSLVWIDGNERLQDQIFYRNRTRRDSAFIKGEKTVLRQIVARSKVVPTNYEIVIVQPGISRSNLPARLAHLLQASNDYIIKSQCGLLRVMASS
jgi:superfamily II DNA or RNA helicase